MSLDCLVSWKRERKLTGTDCIVVHPIQLAKTKGPCRCGCTFAADHVTAGAILALSVGWVGAFSGLRSITVEQASVESVASPKFQSRLDREGTHLEIRLCAKHCWHIARYSHPNWLPEERHKAFRAGPAPGPMPSCWV